MKKLFGIGKTILYRFILKDDPVKKRKAKARIFGCRQRLGKNGYVFKKDTLAPAFYLPLYRDDFIQQTILLTGSYYEVENLNYVCKEWEGGKIGRSINGGCVLDIGANIGNHTLYFFFECGIKRAFCFEPVESTFNILKKNIEINKLEDKVSLVNAAVGSTQGKASVAFYDADNIGSTQIALDEDGAIPVVSIDSLNIQEDIKLIKIDVEGFEKDVFGGCMETIAKHKPTILAEIQPENLEYICNSLECFGYRCVSLGDVNYLLYANSNRIQ